MGDTAISWTDKSWNPSTGCTRVSPGCDHCYAFELHDQRHVAWKRGNMPSAAPQYHKPYSQLQFFPERLSQPLHWKAPQKIFVNSMTDLFHKDVPDEFIAQVFGVMGVANWHTFQVLTKRPERMLSFMTQKRFTFYEKDGETRLPWPLPNVWLGVSTEDQQRADERIPPLLQTPAAVRFISAEPLLGPLDLTPYLGDSGYYADGQPWDIEGLDWVIDGGESGPHFRAADDDWFREIRAQCAVTGVSYFHKQGSGSRPGKNVELDGITYHQFPNEEG